MEKYRDIIKDYIENKNISQAELARRAGVPAYRLKDFLSGKSKTLKDDALVPVINTIEGKDPAPDESKAKLDIMHDAMLYAEEYICDKSATNMQKATFMTLIYNTIKDAKDKGHEPYLAQPILDILAEKAGIDG